MSETVAKQNTEQLNAVKFNQRRSPKKFNLTVIKFRKVKRNRKSRVTDVETFTIKITTTSAEPWVDNAIRVTRKIT